MNRRIAVLIGGICLLLLLPGCGAWLQPIPKDTVMNRVLPEDRQREEAIYEGVLSQEAVKTLSLEAIRRYFEEELTMDELQFELSEIDQNKLKELLSGPRETGRLGLDVKAEFDHLPSGLYFVTMTRTAGTRTSYELVLSAVEGSVLRVERSDRFESAPLPVGRLEVFDTAEQFILDKAEGSLTDVEVNADIIRWGPETTLFYTIRDKPELKYSITVNMVTNRVTGFSKDVMALLRFIQQY